MTDAAWNSGLGCPDQTLDVAIIGAGFSGVCAAIKLRERGITNFRVLEKSHGVGGTWFENAYPGAACDVPSPLYCYSFEANPRWSRLYAPQIEILSYIDMCAEKYGVKPHVIGGQKVTALRFDDEDGVWAVEVADGPTLKAHHVINGSGGLHKPKIPHIPGLEDFGGSVFHTASWDHDVDLEDKRVAVVGSAASAIQVIPQLAKMAASVDIIQRTPNYIMPRHDVAFSKEERDAFAQNPDTQRALREEIFDRLEIENAPILQKNSEAGKRRRQRFLDHLHAIINDPSLREALTPDYEFGCKRVLLSDEFYQTLNLDNVALHTGGAVRIEDGAVITGEGVRVDVDVLIMATGFDLTGHAIEMEVTGKDGQSLLRQWMNGAKTHKGACVPGFPNLYWVTGPNTGVATNSVVHMVEAQIGYILQCIAAAGRGKLMEPKGDIVEAEDAEIQIALKNTVWSSGCHSWYLSDDGGERIGTLYPYDAGRFAEEREFLNIEDFDVSAARPEPISSSPQVELKFRDRVHEIVGRLLHMTCPLDVRKPR